MICNNVIPAIYRSSFNDCETILKSEIYINLQFIVITYVYLFLIFKYQFEYIFLYRDISFCKHDLFYLKIMDYM